MLSLRHKRLWFESLIKTDKESFETSMPTYKKMDMFPPRISTAEKPRHDFLINSEYLRKKGS